MGFFRGVRVNLAMGMGRSPVRMFCKKKVGLTDTKNTSLTYLVLTLILDFPSILEPEFTELRGKST